MVTEIFPVVPLATSAVIVLASTTTKDVAAVLPKLTAVAPVKLVPVIVTVAPVAAVVGVKEVMVGGGGVVIVTLITVGEGAVQPYPFVKLTLTVCVPAEFHNTLIEFVPAPLVIVPPAEAAQVYPVIPVSVEYVFVLPALIIVGFVIVARSR